MSGKEAFLNKMQIYPSKDFLKDIRLPLPKCLIVGEPHRLIPIEAELSVELQGQLSVYRSEPFFLELVPQGIDKAQSLSVLLNKLNMNREEIVAGRRRLQRSFNDSICRIGCSHGQCTGTGKESRRLHYP